MRAVCDIRCDATTSASASAGAGAGAYVFVSELAGREGRHRSGRRRCLADSCALLCLSRRTKSGVGICQLVDKLG